MSVDVETEEPAADVGTTVAALRRRLAEMSGGPPEPGGPGPGVLPVPPVIASVLPRRGLVRGGVVSVSGAATVLIAILAEVTASGGTVALVGLPQVNLSAAADLGADLRRVAVVSEPGVDRLEVAGVLLDGIDLVVVAAGADQVPPARARVLAGRARKQSSTLMAVTAPGRQPWPGAAVRIESEVDGYRHLPVRRSGYGRIGGYGMKIKVSGSGISPRAVRCDLVVPAMGEPGRLELAAPIATSAGDEQRAAGAGARLAVAN
ncbi:MAG: hypothetical protein QM658_05320 [Gordonia sp. (in: high G+C Gram-positive bacteria)]